MENKEVAVKLLTDAVEIEKVERLAMRVAFSIFYRRNSINNHHEEIKALDKIKRFLTSDSNENYLKTSKMFQGVLDMVNKRHEEFEKAIASATANDEAETKLLEDFKAHTYGDKQFDYDYFKSIIPYADVNGDTAEFDWSMKTMMKQYGFIKEEEPTETQEATAETKEPEKETKE